MKSKEN